MNKRSGNHMRTSQHPISGATKRALTNSPGPTEEEETTHSRCRDWTQSASIDQFPQSGNVSLSKALAFLNISHATAYKYGLVPLYDNDGHRIETGKIPPFPLLPLPDDTTLKPAKRWDAAEIRELQARIRHRMRTRIAGNDDSSTCVSSITSAGLLDSLKAEVSYGHA